MSGGQNMRVWICSISILTNYKDCSDEAKTPPKQSNDVT